MTKIQLSIQQGARGGGGLDGGMDDERGVHEVSEPCDKPCTNMGDRVYI